MHNAAPEVRRMVHHDRGGRGHTGQPGRGAVEARVQQWHTVRLLHTGIRHVHAQVPPHLLSTNTGFGHPMYTVTRGCPLPGCLWPLVVCGVSSRNLIPALFLDYVQPRLCRVACLFGYRVGDSRRGKCSGSQGKGSTVRQVRDLTLTVPTTQVSIAFAVCAFSMHIKNDGRI